MIRCHNCYKNTATGEGKSCTTCYDLERLKLKKTLRIETSLLEKMLMFMTTVQTATVKNYITSYAISKLPLYQTLKTELHEVLNHESRRS